MRCKPKSRLPPHSKSVLKPERVKAQAAFAARPKAAALTRSPPVARRRPKTDNRQQPNSQRLRAKLSGDVRR